MRAWSDRILGQSRLLLFTLPWILLLPVLAGLLPPDGTNRTEWAQFIGRFHPLLVHFPIALILLVPILELAGRSPRFSYLRATAEFVLGFATLSATAAATLGWCLARSGGYSGSLLVQHMWGGIFLAAACWLCWLLRARIGENAPGIAYAIALGFSISLVAWTGYRGAQLSLGENHLTEHMPAGLRRALGVSNDQSAASKVDLNTFYGARIHPIFAARCISCHGQGKHKADLRLDSYAALMRGGKDGPAVLAGNIQGSDLVRRISLPPEHDDFMPKGKQRLSADQVKLIELWIGAGASGTLAADAIPDANKGALAGSAAPIAREVVFETIDPHAVEQLRAGIAPAVAQLQKRFPNILDYESRGSADLQMNASILGSKFGDDDMAALAPVADHITTADFSRTSITDRSAPALAAMKRLRVLRLMNTAITDATTDKLSALDQLDSLNLVGTRVTAASLPAAAKLPRLAHLYAGQTAIPAETPVPQALAGKVVF